HYRRNHLIPGWAVHRIEPDHPLQNGRLRQIVTLESAGDAEAGSLAAGFRHRSKIRALRVDVGNVVDISERTRISDLTGRGDPRFDASPINHRARVDVDGAPSGKSAENEGRFRDDLDAVDGLHRDADEVE